MELLAINFLLLLLIFILSPQQSSSMPHNNSTDLQSLLHFKSTVNDPCNSITSNWTSHTSFCSWIGVSCSPTSQRVTALNLSGFCLQGPISPQLANLSFLTSLTLSNNTLSGQIPDSLARLPRLKILDLKVNQLSGPIPTNIFNISSLVQFYAGKNSLSGPFPSDNTTLSVSQLQLVSLGHNKFNGTVPSIFASFSNLQTLYLQQNEFTGTIPTELGDLVNLTGLALGANNLTGNIPASLGNLTRLTVLSLEINMLEGQIPKTLGNLQSLEKLFLGLNALSGSIPSSLLMNASSMQMLELGGTLLTGSLPVELGKSMPDLVYLNMEGLELSGGLGFVPHLSNCRNLQHLFMAHSNLDGIIPDSIGNLSTSLQDLDLSLNRLSGEIPAGIGNLSGLILLDLESNNLTGKIPSTIGRLRGLQMLSINQNRMVGSIPSEIFQLRGLTVLQLHHNALSESIPKAIGNLNGLQHLTLGHNKLSLTVPQSLWTLSNLLDLSLEGNQLEGLIPQQVRNLKSLNTFSISRNRLSGNIPNSIGELQLLTQLDLSRNFFHGKIPQEISGLLNIEYLNLSHNSLTGQIPSSLGNLRYLDTLDLSFNKLTGQIPRGRVFSNLSIPYLKGNEALCGASHLGFPPCAKNESIYHAEKGHKLLKYVVPSTVCVIIIVILLACFFLSRAFPRRRKVENQEKNDIQNLNYYRLISYLELVRATDNFSEANLLGKGSFGSVFKGCLDDGLLVAVKVMNLEVEGASKSFDAECSALRMTRHRNLVKILSTCSNMDFKSLVLQFMQNGSLEMWLHSQSCKLDLLQRINIMLDVALALDYLHHQHPQVIVHCDLKPSNVLLDEDMNAHLSDFGIAKLFLGGSKFTMSMIAPGTIGYMPPEYGSAGKVSRKGDVYSFGILLFETFTRKKPTDAMFGAELSLRQWVNRAYPSAVMEIVDITLLRNDFIDDKQTDIKVAIHQSLLSIIDLGLLCSRDSPNERILMKEVVPRLQKIKGELISKFPQ